MKIFIIVATLVVSLALFVTSLFLPAFILADGSGYASLSVLMIGWMALFLAFDRMGVGSIGWFANLCLIPAWLGLMLVSKFRPASIGGLILSVVGIGLALSSLLLTTVVTSAGGTETEKVISMGLGFYIWLASFIVCLMGYIIILVVDTTTKKPEALKEVTPESSAK